MRKFIICLVTAAVIGLSCGLPASGAQFDKYGGWEGMKGKSTGWFHTEKINGRWWIITPQGNIFWSIGVYSVRFGGIPETGTGKRAYRDACMKKYGSEKEWARVTKIKLKNWGFNTLGDWSSVTVMNTPGIAYVIGIDKSTKAPNVIAKGHYGYFPDVFDARFAQGAREEVKKKLGWYTFAVNDPWLLGYFLADEPSWYGSKGRRGSLVDDFIRLGGSRPGKIAWVNFIKSRYSDIARLNNAWKTHFKNWNELLLAGRIADNQNTRKDKLGFLEVIAEKFSGVLSHALREFDKNHMILGTRPSRLYPEVVEGVGKHLDIFSMSAYGLNQGYEISPKFSETIKLVYKYSHKPIMLGVLISAQDTGLPYGIVKTQKDRGISYWRYLAKAAQNPDIVGMHWFQYFDPPRKCYDRQAANWGLVNGRDETYQAAVSLISRANKMVYAYGLGLSQFVPGFNSMIVKTKIAKVSQPRRPSSAAKQLKFSNPGFEQGRSGWSLQSWKGHPAIGIDRHIPHFGKSSLRIKGSASGWSSVGVAIRGHLGITLSPDKQYRLSAWIKTKGVEDMAFVRIKLKYTDGETKYFGATEAYGTEGWKLYKVTFSPGNKGIVDYLACELVGKGVAWFDDISIEELGK